MDYPTVVDYSIANTEALDLRDDFDLVQTAALIADIDPAMLRQSADGHLTLKRDWDCPCEEHQLARSVTFGNEPLQVGTLDQHMTYSAALSKFNVCIDSVYSAVEGGKLKMIGTPQFNTKQPAYRNIPRYAQIGAPEPHNTRVAREDIVAWLTSKGRTHGYFFSKYGAQNPSVEDKLYDRPYLTPGDASYAPILHALLQAMDYKMLHPHRTMTCKQQIIAFIEKYGIPGLEELDGNDEKLSETLLNYMGKIGNSDRKGGPRRPRP